MNRNFNIIVAVLMTLALVVSCKSDFTEEDALNRQQAIDLALYIFNQSDPAKVAIDGATVTVTQNGKTTVVTTDATGMALFPGMKVGDYLYRVEATDFTTRVGVGTTTTTNFRIGQVTTEIGLPSTTDADLATVKGTVTLETDLTNVPREFAGAIEIFFDITIAGQNRRFSATTDATGNYTIKLPVDGANPSMSVNVLYPDLEKDQTIAVNKWADETGTFSTLPQLLPKKEVVKTVFSMQTAGSQFSTLPSVNGVRSVWGIIPAPTAGGQPIVTSVSTNGSGQITGITFSPTATYANNTTVTIPIASIDGGSGGSIAVFMGNQADLQTAYNITGTSTRTITVGSGYPVNISSSFTLNKTATRSPSFRTGFTIAKGALTIANGDYGTGIYRPRDPQ